MMNKSVCLFSGGLDSATLLYYSIDKGYKPHCLIFDYGQRHGKEIEIAKRLARRNKCPYSVVQIKLPWKGSALLDKTSKLPTHKRVDPKKIPSTYVPARNIIFLSFAASYAESIKAGTIFIGANAVDYSGYPDCRPEFYKAYQQALTKGTKAGVEGNRIKIKIPFIRKTKTQIIKLGLKLKVPYEYTWSCYQGSKVPCGRCDSCKLRQKGFQEVGQVDPLLQRKK